MKAKLGKDRQNKPSKKIVRAKKMQNPIVAEWVNGSRVTKKYSWCWVIVCAKHEVQCAEPESIVYERYSLST